MTIKTDGYGRELELEERVLIPPKQTVRVSLNDNRQEDLHQFEDIEQPFGPEDKRPNKGSRKAFF